MSSLDSLATIAVVGVVGFVGYELSKGKTLQQAAAALAQAPHAIAATLQAPGVAAGSTGNSALDYCPSGVCTDVCSAIAYWRANVAPGANLFGLNLGIFGFNPNDWNAFRAWTQKGLNYAMGMQDPGPNPPSCWGNYTATTGGEPTYYEGQAPGGLGY